MKSPFGNVLFTIEWQDYDTEDLKTENVKAGQREQDITRTLLKVSLLVPLHCVHQWDSFYSP